MSQNVLNNLSPSPSNTFTTKNLSDLTNLPDFTALASALNAATQALLNYNQQCTTSIKDKSTQGQSTQYIDAQTHSHSPPLSNQAKRRKCHQKFDCNPMDTRAFADKEISQFFTQEYMRGNFRGEVHYYYIPANIVRFEHQLLKQHQQKNILSLLSNVYNELDLKNKLIAHIGKDIDELSLKQINYSISQSLMLFHTIYAHLDNFKLIHKTMLARQK